LVAFMADVVEEHSRGGRVVAHHLDLVSNDMRLYVSPALCNRFRWHWSLVGHQVTGGYR
jgi:hypothetical protein